MAKFSFIILLFSVLPSHVIGADVSQLSIGELEAAYKENPRDIDVALELGIRYHDQMREAGKNAAYGVRRNRKKLDLLRKLALKYLKRAQFMTKFAPLPNAYIGSVTVLRGRDVSYSGRGMLVRWRAPKNFRDGAEMIDAQVKAAPDNIQVRLIRIADAEYVPNEITDGSDMTDVQERMPRISRFQLALKDLDWLLEKCKEEKALAKQLNVPKLHFKAGKFARRLSKFDIARSYFDTAIRLGKGTETEEKARALIKKMPESVDDALKKDLRGVVQ